MASKKDIAELIDWCLDFGFHVGTTKKGHWQVYIGDDTIVVISSTPSDPRSVRNAKAAVKRAMRQEGYDEDQLPE